MYGIASENEMANEWNGNSTGNGKWKNGLARRLGPHKGMRYVTTGPNECFIGWSSFGPSPAPSCVNEKMKCVLRDCLLIQFAHKRKPIGQVCNEMKWNEMKWNEMKCYVYKAWTNRTSVPKCGLDQEIVSTSCCYCGRVCFPVCGCSPGGRRKCRTKRL